ncbi:MAG TPA: sulfite exporter TauE/SafE family protein [Candidatus Saccharimonadales bacterium]|nr:sulfite exporter TauE/SafE family protein [Candidatus Saccharimonadales bacterium]
MHIDLYVALAGLIVGCAVGLTGMGGGALMTPILVLLFGVAPLAAVSSDLVASLIMKPVGAAVHAGRGTVRWNLAGWLAIGSVPFAFLGVVFLKSIGSAARVQTIVSVALGSVLLVAVAALLFKMYLDHRNGTSRGPDEKLIIRKIPTVAIGASIGFIVGITSVGSGTLVIVLLLFLYPRLRGSQMVGTDLAQAIPMVGSAALAHIVFGDFKLGLTASILIGSIPGVVIGAAVSSYAPTAFLRGALAAVILVSGLKLVNVPTLGIGIVLLASIVVLLGTWLWIRASGRTLREVSGESPVQVKAPSLSTP